MVVKQLQVGNAPIRRSDKQKIPVPPASRPGRQPVTPQTVKTASAVSDDTPLGAVQKKPAVFKAKPGDQHRVATTGLPIDPVPYRDALVFVLFESEIAQKAFGANYNYTGEEDGVNGLSLTKFTQMSANYPTAAC